jgi:hypothetical protein
MKKPMKLCPLRLATRAGQNAMATQMMAKTIQPIALTGLHDSHVTLQSGLESAMFDESLLVWSTAAYCRVQLTTSL